eukprot:3589116-Alexandrium_andersonii.AAC.1
MGSVWAEPSPLSMVATAQTSPGQAAAGPTRDAEGRLEGSAGGMGREGAMVLNRPLEAVPQSGVEETSP